MHREEQEQKVVLTRTAFEDQEKDKLDQDIYPITEGCQSDYTKRTYKNSFNRFLKHIGISDLQVLIDLGPKALEQIIIKYVIYLRDSKKLARATIELEGAAIYHFFEMNDIMLNKHKIKRFLPPDESTHDDRLYTQQEKEKILTECDKRDKVVVLLMNAGGIRIGSINKLKISDLEPVSEYDIYKLTVYSMSKKDRYWTLVNLECANAVRDYLQQREKQGEIIKSNSPLIREQCDPKDHFRMQHPRFISEPNVRYLVFQTLIRSGVKTSEVMMSHAFRKNFKTVCEESGMKSLHVEMLTGHRDALVKSYMRPKDSDLIEDYMTHAADALTISSEHRLKKQVQQLEIKHSEEWAALKTEMYELKRLVESVKSLKIDRIH